MNIFDKIMRLEPDQTLVHVNANGRWHIEREYGLFRLRLGLAVQRIGHNGGHPLSDISKRRLAARLLDAMGEPAPELAHKHVVRIGTRYAGYHPYTQQVLVYADTPAEAEIIAEFERVIDKRQPKVRRSSTKGRQKWQTANR